MQTLRERQTDVRQRQRYAKRKETDPERQILQIKTVGRQKHSKRGGVRDTGMTQKSTEK